MLLRLKRNEPELLRNHGSSEWLQGWGWRVGGVLGDGAGGMSHHTEILDGVVAS